MTFVEFIEAIVRVAEKLEIPNLIEDEEVFIGMEMTDEQRDEWGSRELPEKVTSLILYLVKTHLTSKEYKKHCAMLGDYKEEAEEIYANDIELGSMKLQ